MSASAELCGGRSAMIVPTATSLTTDHNKRSWRVPNHPSSLLERFAFRPPKAKSDALYLVGNRIGATYLNLTGARACPDCVTDNGFIEAHWHIDLMVACPCHERAPVWYCPECKKPLNWMRPGLLTCKCGAPFQSPSKAIFSPPEVQLLGAIRRKRWAIRLSAEMLACPSACWRSGPQVDSFPGSVSRQSLAVGKPEQGPGNA